MTPLPERVRALEEREKGFTTLMGERFDRQDEVLADIRSRLDSLAPRLTSVERKQAYAAAWLAGAIAAGTALGGVVFWLISLAGK